jgi:hypothetical protein
VRSSFSFVGTISSVGCDRGHSWYTRFPLSELFPLSDVIVAIRGCVYMRCTYTTYPDIRFTRFDEGDRGRSPRQGFQSGEATKRGSGQRTLGEVEQIIHHREVVGLVSARGGTPVTKVGRPNRRRDRNTTGGRVGNRHLRRA